MPSFRRRDSVLDADRVEKSTAKPDRVTDAEQAQALIEEAEAEAAEAEALAAAARARARAARLRRQAMSADATTSAAQESHAADAQSTAVDLAKAEPAAVEPVAAPVPATADAGGGDTGETLPGNAADTDLEEYDEAVPTKRRRRIPRPGWKSLVAALVVLCTAALLGLSGWMIFKHREADNIRQANAEYSAAARQSVVTLMSLDFTKAEEDVQRIIDNSTGQFRDDFESQAEDFVKVAQDSKVVTEVSVTSTAVESMTDNTADVLVAASSKVSNTAGANQEPRTWRLSVSLVREDGQIKMSKVEFVP